MGPRPPKFHFYFDENFPAWIGKFLRTLGHNVISAITVEHGSLRSASDSRQLDYCRKTGRIFVTLDRDFRQQHLARKVALSPGVIVVQGNPMHIEAVSKILVTVVRTYSPVQLAGRILRASIDKQALNKPAEG